LLGHSVTLPPWHSPALHAAQQQAAAAEAKADVSTYWTHLPVQACIFNVLVCTCFEQQLLIHRLDTM
jgi:hypothetical protein